MKDDDLVDLIFVTQGTNFLPVCVTRLMASQIIYDWYYNREILRSYSFFRLLWHRLFRWLWRPYSVTYNETSTKSGNTYTFWGIDSKQIIGIYTREKGISSHDILAESQKRIADVMEKQQKELNRGDEWRSEEDN